MPAMLAGDLVVLRPLRAADRATSVRWRNDPDIRDNILGYRFPITEEMEAQWVGAVLEDRSRSRLVLAIEDKADGALCGFVYLNGIDWFARNAELAETLVRSHVEATAQATLAAWNHRDLTKTEGDGS